MYKIFNGKEYKQYNGYYGTTTRPYVYLHRAIWEYFRGTIPSGYVIHHIDENLENNHLENFQLMTRSKHTIYHCKNISSETRAKMSLANSGINNPMFGHIYSAETKRKMSLAKAGSKHTTETKAKMSKAQKIRRSSEFI